MKKISYILIPCIIFVLLFSLFGCSEQLKTNKDYTLYYFDVNTYKFAKANRKITFDKNVESCYMYFNNDNYIQSPVTKAEKGINSVDVTLDSGILESLKQSYKLYLEEEGVLDANTIDQLVDTVVVKDTFYYSKDKLISANSVTYAKSTNFEGKLSSLEGIYYNAEGDTYIKLEEGFVYSYNTENKTFDTKTLSYVMSKDVIYFTKINADGSVFLKEGRKVQTAYLYFCIKYPEDFEISTDENSSDLEKLLKKDAAKYKGNEVACLANSFYWAE